MTILAMVNAEKEGQLESKIMKAVRCSVLVPRGSPESMH